MHHRILLVVAAVAAATVVVLMLGGRFGDIGFHVREVVGTLGNIRPGWVVLSLFLLAAGCVVRAVRWYLLIRPAAPRATVGGVFGATLIGFTAVVLFGRPGELVRPYLIGCRSASPFSSQVAAWVLERIWDLLAVILIFACALSQLRVDPVHLGPGLQWVLRMGGSVAFGLAIAAVVALVAIGFLSEPMQEQVLRLVRRFPKPLASRLGGIITAFVTGTASTRRPSQVATLAVLTALEWGIISVQTYAILKAFPPTSHLGVIDSLVFLGFVAFGSVVQVPGIGGGVQVAGAVVLTELFGLHLEVATGVAIGYWLLTWVALVPGGIVAALIAGVSWRSLRHIEEQSQAAGTCAEPVDSVAVRPVHLQ